MELLKHKNFEKDYLKLSLKYQKLVESVLVKFVENHFDASLRNHKLKGKYFGLNSIDVANDLRIIFREEGDYAIVLLIRVGKHSQLY